MTIRDSGTDTSSHAKTAAKAAAKAGAKANGQDKALLMAQAQNGEQNDAANGAQQDPPNSTRIPVGADHIVQLPAGTSLEAVQIAGNDVWLNQPDGSIIIIPGAAADVPTFVIGDITIPAETIVTALENAPETAPAAGAEGANSSSGGNFSVPPGDIGDPFDLTALLPPTGLQFGVQSDQLLGAEYVAPTVDGVFDALRVYEAALDENGLPDGADLTDGRTEGTDPSSPNETVFEMGVTYTAGSLPMEVFFGDPSGINFTNAAPGLVVEWVLVSPTRLEGFIRQPAEFATVPGETEPSIVLQLNDTSAAPYEAIEPTLTVTLGDNFPHILPNVAGETIFLSGLNVIGSDGVTDLPRPIVVEIVDDMPDVNVDPGDGSVTHDESLLAQGDADDINGIVPNIQAALLFAGVGNIGSDPDGLFGLPLGFAESSGSLVDVTTIFGADEAADADAIVYALSTANGTDSGIDTTEGDDILLYNEAGIIVGRVGGPGGEAAFALHIDADTGEVTLAQWLSVFHPDDGDADDEISLADGAVSIQVTITDGDGDTDTGSADISGQISFQDDGPELLVWADRHASVTHDETLLWQNDADDIQGLVNNFFAALFFSPVDDQGNDPDSLGLPLGFAQSDGPLVNILPYFGTDGPADDDSIVYSLDLAGEGVDSGLETTEGDSISLFTEGDYIVGRVAGGDAAFAIYIDPESGEVAIAQWLSLNHPDTGDHDDEIALDDDLLSVVVTITDGDGDSISAGADVSGQIIFQDDGPSVLVFDNHNTLEHDETLLWQNDADDVEGIVPNLIAAALFSGVDDPGHDPDVPLGLPIGYAYSASALVDILPLFGTDGPADDDAVAYSLTIENSDSGLQTTEGEAIYLFNEDGFIVGRVGGEDGDAAFAIYIDPETGSVAMAQWLSLNHPDAGDPDDDISLGEDVLSVTVTVTDGDGDTASGSTDVSGQIIFQDDGPLLTGHESSATVYENDLDNYGEPGIFGIFDIVEGSDGTSPDGDTTAPIGGFIGNLIIDPIFAGSTADQGSLANTVYFGTDGPGGFYFKGDTAPLEDQGLKSKGGTVEYASITAGGTSFIFGYVSNIGDDTIDDIFSALQDIIDGGFPSGGDIGDILAGFAGVNDPEFRLVFGVGVEEDGDYEFRLFDQLDHADSGPGDTTIEIDFSGLFEARDGDGDPVDLDGVFTVEVKDDTPDADLDANRQAELRLDESAGPDASDPNANDEAPAIGNHPLSWVAGLEPIGYASLPGGSIFSDNSEVGADEPGTKSYSFDLDTANPETGLHDTETGQEIVLQQLTNPDPNIDVVVGYLDGTTTPSFVILLDKTTGETGVWQYRALAHSDPTDSDEADTPLSLPDGLLGIEVTITDFDGDTDSDSVDLGSIIKFEDDGPVILSITENSGVNLVVNGSFEDGHGLTGADWNIFDGITGWTTGPDNIPFEIQTGAAGGLGAQDGNALVELDGDTEGNPENTPQGTPQGDTNATIQQAITTEAGQAYELTFWYAPRPGQDGDSTSMKAFFGGMQVFDSATDTLPAPDANGWYQITVTVNATGPSSVLAFQGTGTQDEFGAFLDNVSLVASATLDDEDINNPASPGIQDGPGDDGAGLVTTGQITFDAGTDGLKSISITDIPDGLQGVYVDGDGNGTPFDIETTWTGGEDADGLAAGYEQGGTLLGYMDVPGEGEVPAFTIEVASDGSYIFTLIAPLSHPFTDADSQNDGPETEWEDNLSLDFEVTVTDGDDDTATGTLTVNVDDDTPDPVNDVADVGLGTDAPPAPTSNIIIVLDRSSSMAEDADGAGPGTMTRFDLAKAAALNLIDAGNVNNVMIVTFNNEAEFQGWMSPADAQTFLTGYNPSLTGLTDYDDALAQVVTNYGSVPSGADQTMSYFFSDGEPLDLDIDFIPPFFFIPNPGSIGPIEQVIWETFLNDNGITSYAVGVGTGISQTDDDLEDVAHPDSVNNPIILTDPDGLLSTLPPGGGATGGTADGNVLENDNFGADGFGGIVSIEVDGDVYPSGGAPSVTVNTDLGGTLTFWFEDSGVHEAGDWSYTGPSDGSGGEEVITYIVGDGDGDGESATLTLTVEADETPTVTVPQIGDDGTVVDEAALDAANNGGQPGSSEIADNDGDNNSDPGEMTSGAINFTPGNTPATVTIDSIVVTGVGQTFTGDYGTLEITSYDPNGTIGYKYTLTGNTLDHPDNPDTGTSEGIQDSFDIQVEDDDGDIANGTLNIDVLDDGPTAGIGVDDVSARALHLTLDETIAPDAPDGEDRYSSADGTPDNDGDEDDTGVLTPVASTNPAAGQAFGHAVTNIIGSFAALFPVTSAYGADGPGTDGVTYGFALSGSTSATNLTATALDGTPLASMSEADRQIELVNNGGVIEGRTTDGDFVVFRISITGAPGSEQLQIDQFLPIDHGDDGNAFDTNALLRMLGDGELNLTASYTITDGDGDSVTVSDDVSLANANQSYFSFDDDGPDASQIELSITGDGHAGIIHDETTGVDAGADDQASSPPGALTGLGSLIGWAESLIDVDTDGGTANPTAAYGTDGPGSTTVTLTDSTGGTFNGTATNLYDTETGNRIFLFTEGGILVGRVGTAGDAADNAGDIAFALTIDGTDLQLGQYRAIQHGDTNSDDESVTLLGSDDTSALVYVNVEVTDADGDTDTLTLPFDGTNDGIGAITFEDDGPHAGVVADVSGAEQDALALNLDETIDPDGNATNDGADRYSTTDSLPYDHNGDSDDTGVTALTISTAPLSGDAIGGLTTSVTGGLDALFSTAGTDAGTDGEANRTDTLTLVLSAAVVATTLTATAVPGTALESLTDLSINLVENGGAIEGVTADGDYVVFRISITGAPGSEQLTVEQFLPIDHGADGNAFDTEAILQLAAGGELTLVNTVEITDGDGDTDTSSASVVLADENGSAISFDDDGPRATDTIALDVQGAPAILDDENQADGIDGGPGDDGNGTSVSGILDVDGGTDGIQQIAFAETVAATVTNGVDAPQPVTLQAIHVDPVTGEGTPETITLQWTPDGSGGGTLAGVSASYPAGTPAFTLVVDSAGNYTFTALAPLSHLYTDDPATGDTEIEFEDNLNLNFGFTVTDGDGDTSTASLNIQVDDDTPDATPDALTADGDPGAAVSAALGFEPGADGWSGVDLHGNTPPDGLTSDGDDVHYWVNDAGDMLIGYTGTPIADGGTPPTDQVFKVTIDPETNQWSFQVLDTLDGVAGQVLAIGGSSFGAGPQDYQILSTGTGGTGEQLSVASGWLTNGGGFDYNDWFNTGDTTGVVHDDINGSTGGWGVGNNNATTGEFMRFDFGALTDFDGAGSYTPPAFTGGEVTQANFAFPFFGATDDVSYRAYFSGGGVENVEIADPTQPLTIDAPSGETIDYIEFYVEDASGSAKIQLASVGVQTDGSALNLSFDATLTDGDGDAEGVSLAVTVDQPNDIPTLSVSTDDGMVWESALPDGTGGGDLTAGGALAITASDGIDTVEVKDWQDNWIDVTGGGNVDGEFGTLTITESGGSYTWSYELDDNTLDHDQINVTGAGDQEPEIFDVRVTDNNGDSTADDSIQATEQIVVDINDDGPLSENDTANAGVGVNATVNTILVIDLSTSMNGASGFGGLSRLELLQQAVTNYLSSPDVDFGQIVIYTFNDGATWQGTFTDVAAAIAEVNGYDNGDLVSATEYDSTADDVADDFTNNVAPLNAADLTNLLFLSDGDPTGGSSLDPGAEQTNWLNFLNNNGIDEVTAIGFGGIVSTSFLDPLAPRPGDEAIAVTDPAQLSETLQGTLPDPASGNVLANDQFGADGGYIQSIEVNGVTYAFDGNNIVTPDGATPSGFENHGTWIVVPTDDGGTLTFRFADGGGDDAGDWSYAPGDDPTIETFDYVLVDGDGDTAGATLTINVTQPMMANNDNIITNIVDGSPIVIPESALLFNDQSGTGDPLDVTVLDNPVGGTVNFGSVIFDPDGGGTETLESWNFNGGDNDFDFENGGFFDPSEGNRDSNGGPDNSGALHIALGGTDSFLRGSSTGIWSRNFTLLEAASVTITFQYLLQMSNATDSGEDSEVRISIDGTTYSVDDLAGSGNNSQGGTTDTGWQTYSITLDLSDGNHTLDLSAYMADQDQTNEYADAWFDNVSVTTPGGIGGSFDYTATDGATSDDAGVTVTGQDSSTIVGTSGEDVIVGGDGDDILIGDPADPVAFTITADGEGDEDNDDFLHFNFTGGDPGAAIQSIVIDLSADGNANFDPGGGNDWGPDLSGFFGGLSGGDVSVDVPDGGQLMTITFDPGTFTAGMGFDLNIKTQNLGGNDGDDFGDEGVTATIMLEDGTSQTVTFGNVDSNTSEAVFSITPTGAADALVGGGGADTFVLNNLDAVDLIADYNYGEGDSIDLSALLDSGANDGNIDDYVRMGTDGSGQTVLQVDSDGGGDGFQTAAVFGDVPVTIHILYDGDDTDVSGSGPIV